ncbi:DUF302 domain-containing protein [Dyella koreensis]|uniref:DUF302 domain-containing protein n=1 Tax=Dyella koreensis TaxID=311235 RepID=A0ABW8K649_9GAMM
MNTTTDTVRRVDYGQIQHHTFQRSATTGHDFEKTLQLVRETLLDADLWIVHEIDPQMLLKKGGYAIHQTRQILFFHPRYMVRLLGLDPSALLEAPLKIVVMADASGKVMLRWHDPEALFSKYGVDGLIELGREFSEIYAAIVARLGASL